MRNERLRITGLSLILAAALLYLARLSHASFDFLRVAFVPDAGKSSSLTYQVQAARDLLVAAITDEYDLAPALIQDSYFRERLVEFGYPARLRVGAKRVLAPADDPNIDASAILLRSNYFVIYERPGK